MQIKDPQEWGYYAPPNSSWLLRIIIAIGFARGSFKKKIIRNWKDRYGPIVDIEYSSIRYRLNLMNNITDLRILTSHKRYDREEINALKLVCKNNTFIDLGANIGFYTLSLAAAGAKVIAVEPNPKTLARLKYNTELNEFAPNITIIPVGVGEEGIFQLVSSGDLGSANICPNNSLNNKSVNRESVTVQVRPLLDILNEQGVTRVDGLKIDIEGMEDRALLPFFKCAPKSMWPKCIVIEHCTRDQWIYDILSYMLNNGYKFGFKTRANTVLHLDLMARQ